MDNKIDKEQFIDDILSSIEGIQQAEMPPYFYTRLMAKINKEPQPSRWFSLISFTFKPVFTLATLLIFIVLNVAALSTIIHHNKNYADTNHRHEATIENFAQEYNISVSTLYNDSKTVQ